MELAAQPICLPICMNAYFFRGRFVLHLQTGNVNRSAISSGAFAVFHLEIHWIQSWNTPPPPHAFGIPKCVYPPPHIFRIPVQETPPLPRNSKMPPVVWYGYFLESPNTHMEQKHSDWLLNWKEAINLVLNKEKKQGNKKEKPTQSLHLIMTVEMKRRVEL